MYPASRLRRFTLATGLYGDARTGSESLTRACKLSVQSLIPDPVPMTVCPYVILRPACIPPSTAPAVQTTGTVSLYASSFVISAQAMRAIRFASATATSIRGLRVSIRGNHEPRGTPRRATSGASGAAPTRLTMKSSSIQTDFEAARRFLTCCLRFTTHVAAHHARLASG